MDGFVFFERYTKNMGRFFKNSKLIIRARTDFQEVLLLEHPDFGKVLFLDGLLQIAEKDDFFYHEPLIHPAMLSVEKPKKVLIIGGGDGAALREVLRYKSVEEVHLVELDSKMVEFSKKYLRRINLGAFDDPRAKVFIQDGRKFVEDKVKEGERYDVVVSDLIDPFGPAKFLYTKEFYLLVKGLIGKKGVFSTHTDFLFYRDAFASINNTLRSSFPYVKTFLSPVPMYGHWMGFSLSSNSPLNQRKKEFDFFDIYLNNFPPVAKEIISSYPKISTDSDPFELKF